ncbi:TIGR04255 family protein [Rhabdothermincola sediminis]|uniref:TIGR04255 family protein n=1 Tax=Rhabdothermincola sediminis TaxID=2751370 RepID=UPI001AA0A49D|nr:TIGR04255 family protein [Rhabdothermincola sediminis]
MTSYVETPFGPAVEEIPLPGTPLVLALAQVRFPQIISIETNEAFIASFQELIREEYPILNQVEESAVLIGAEGPVQRERHRVWRFSQPKDGWQVALTKDFIALTSHEYTSRGDFLSRLRRLLVALDDTIGPKVCTRLGIRYVDRLTDDGKLASIDRLVNEPIRGAARVGLGEPSVEELHALSDHLYRLHDESALHARWGFVPPGATFDPGIEPADSASWVLDLDAYSTEPVEWSPETLVERSRIFCERIYRYFRWAVTDDFLIEHGGKL